MLRRLTVLLGFVFAAVSNNPIHAAGRVFDATPEAYRELIFALKAGDSVRLVPGEYRRGLPVHGLTSTPDAPTVISGPAGANPALFVARAGANTVSIINSANVHIRDLTLEGRKIPVDTVNSLLDSRFRGNDGGYVDQMSPKGHNHRQKLGSR